MLRVGHSGVYRLIAARQRKSINIGRPQRASVASIRHVGATARLSPHLRAWSHTGKRRTSALPGNAGTLQRDRDRAAWTGVVVALCGVGNDLGSGRCRCRLSGLVVCALVLCTTSTEKSRHPEAVGRQVLIRNHRSRRVTRPCRLGSCAAEPWRRTEPARSFRLQRDTQWIGMGLDVVVDAWLVGPLSRPRLERKHCQLRAAQSAERATHGVVQVVPVTVAWGRLSLGLGRGVEASLSAIAVITG